VKSRLTNWIAAAVLLLVASFGVPVARTGVALQSSIVWVDSSGEVRREIVEPRHNSCQSTPEKPVVLSCCDSRARVTLLDRSLFQRPPPVSLS
jgi:hypothetical protein